MNEIWAIIKGSTFGEMRVYSDLVGYDWETGEPEYEMSYDWEWNPHEDIIEKFDSREAASERFMALTEAFENEHRWPWNSGHFSKVNGVTMVEFTDNDDSIWFKLQKEEDFYNEQKEKAKQMAEASKGAASAWIKKR